MVTEVKNTNYWISSSALYIQLNAMGEPDYIQSSVVSGASILCYMNNVPGLGYDAGHNYQRWTLASYPSIFPDSGKKYIYVAIPRVRTGDNDIATVVFPSQRIDLYGKAIIEQTKEDGSKELVSGDQIGNENFYYIYLQGIISEVKTDTDNTRKREWEQHVDYGSLATDEAIASGGEGAWWRYNSVTDTITFLKTILKAAFEELTAKVAKITKLILNGKEVTGVADNTTLETSNTTVVTPQYLGQFGVKHFLAKDKDDTAEGKITFIKGLVSKGLADLMMGAKFGNNAMITQLGEAVFSAIKSLDYDNAAEQGFSVEKEKNGKYHAFVTNLTIWGKAIFHELEVRKLSYSGGNIYLSGAGSKLIKVVPVKKSVSNGVTSWVETTEDDVECVGWKCYLLADNGTTATMNYWQEGDQVRCQTIGEIAAGGAYSDVSNKSYWRTIPDGGVSTQNEKIYGTMTETYLDEAGKEQTREVQVELYGGQSFAWIVVGKHSADFDGYTEDGAPAETKDIPAEGDTIVLDGNRHRNKGQEYDKTDRQNVIILETTGEYAPRIACYANISEYKHTFVKSVNGENKEVSLSVFETSPKGGTKINSSRFEWISDDGSTINIINYRGDWVSGNKYHKNDQVNHNNAVWVCVANSGVDVSEEPSDGSSNWKKVLSGGKGEKGDDAVSYSVSLMKEARTFESHPDQPVIAVSFRKQEGSKSTVSGNIKNFGVSALAICYVDGYYNSNMTDWVNGGEDYFDYSSYEEAWAGKSVITVVMYIGLDNPVASANFSLGQIGEGVVMAYKNAPSRPAPPTTKDPSLLSDGWSRTPQKGGSYIKVDNISYGSFDNGASSSVDSTSKSWTDVTEDGNSWKKSPSGLSDNHEWAIMKVTFSTNVDNLDVKVIIKAYSEANFDFIQVHALDTEITGSSDLRKKGVVYTSGNGVEDSYSYHVATEGQHFFYVSYCKDTSGHSNGDYGLFRFDLSDNLVSMPSTVWMSQAVLKDGKAVLPWSTPIQITGDDAVSYNLNFVTYKDNIHNDTLLYVYIVRSVGKESTTILISNIPQTSEFIGITAEVYCDGVYNENLTNYVKSSGYIQRSAWKTVKNFEVRLYTDGKLVASNSYSFGEQGTDGKDAISILVEDAPLVFDTDDSGTVPASVTKTAKVKVMKGNTNVANDCTQLSSRDDLSSNCMCNVGKDEDNGCISVSVQGNWISKNDVIVDGVNQGKVSATSGYAVAQFVYAGVVYFAQVPFSVNVAKFTGSVVANNKKFETNFTEISNRFKNTPTNDDLTKAESRITQTAREISLSVSEKSVGRRNMLVGSACRKYGDGFMYMSGAESQYYDGYPLEQIEKNSGIDGVNCIHCRTKQTGTDSYYLSGFRWYGLSPQGNIKLEKGKNYVLSFYAKTHTPNDIYFYAEVLYQGSKIDTSRPAGYAGPTGYSTTFAASEAGKWELFTVKVSVPSNAKYEYVEINIFARAKGYSFVDGYICKPMLEEGENYNGWTLSEQDYDYVGGNLLDNARTLDKSGTLNATNDTVIQNGYGTDSACIKNLMQANATLSDYKEVLRWSFGSTYLVNGNDYIFSFVAKADVDDARVVCYMWSGDIENSCDIFTEGNGGTWDSQVDGNVVFILSRQWTRYWVHWRPKDGYATPKEVIIRHTGNNSTSAATVYVTQPKLEIGATMTEWTERKTDLVDKASLKAAGIVVDSESVTLYGNQVHIKKNKTDANDTVLIDNETGQVSAGLINAYEVVAKGIKTQELEAQNLNVTGNSRLGIFEIKTSSIDERDQYSIAGDMITYRGSYKLPDGKTDITSIDGLAYLMYKPLFIRQGAPENGRYMRLGNNYTEWDDCGTGNGDSYLFNGASARYVCSGSSNCTYYALPKNLSYNTGYFPVSYIYATKATQNDPAFAINVVKTKDSSDGTRTAIQTNGAIRGVIAPNLRIMNYSGQISSSDCIVIVTKGGITLKLPAGPVVGQTLLIYSKVSSNVYIEYDSSGGYGTGKMYSDGSLQTKIKIGRAGTFTYFIFDGENWCYAYFNGSHNSA